jgi:hypothetical protein
LLYCLPLLFKVWQRSGSCCCHIVYHYCLWFDRGVVHVFVVILFTIAVEGLTEEWFILLLVYCLPLLFKIWKRSGSRYCCYIVYHYCLRFDRGMVHVVGGYIVYHYYLKFERWVVHVVVVISSTIMLKVWQRSGSCWCCYVVYHYCSRFDRGVVHVVVVILSTINIWGLTEEWFMLLLYLPLMFSVWQRSGSCYCCYIFYHYCLRMTEERIMLLLLLLYCLPLLFKVWQRSGSCGFSWRYCLPLLL